MALFFLTPLTVPQYPRQALLGPYSCCYYSSMHCIYHGAQPIFIVQDYITCNICLFHCFMTILAVDHGGWMERGRTDLYIFLQRYGCLIPFSFHELAPDGEAPESSGKLPMYLSTCSSQSVLEVYLPTYHAWVRGEANQEARGLARRVQGKLDLPRYEMR